MYINNIVTWPNTGWHSCGCWGHCRCYRPQPQYWCSQCCCYSYYQHFHPLPVCPPVIYGYDRDERIREEGRREERERQRRKKHPNLPYVDITPALPRYRR